MKKLFPCGHKGKGKYCHRCDNKEKLKTATDNKRIHKNNIRERIRSHKAIHDAVPPNIASKAHVLIKKLEAGMHFWELKGKQINADKNIVSIPIGQHFRLICDKVDGGVSPVDVMTHSQFDRKYSRNKNVHTSTR